MDCWTQSLHMVVRRHIVGGTYNLGIDDFSVLLGVNGQCICHQVINQLWIFLGKAVCDCKYCRVNDGVQGIGQLKLVGDVP